jgi:hypothetical protein
LKVLDLSWRRENLFGKGNRELSDSVKEIHAKIMVRRVGLDGSRGVSFWTERRRKTMLREGKFYRR